MSQARQFGNYELCLQNDEPELLGAGSFGKTYRGKHRFLNTNVAVKVIRQQYSDNEAYKKTFLEEARLVAQLSDPHIVQIRDFGEQDARLYYVMDFCDGGTLHQLVKSPQDITDSLVIEIARQAARALVCAHRQGIIHRDFKPENIMLDSAGEGGALLVKLIDFGLAQSVANIAGFAEARAEGFHGTPFFASPEQLREEPLDGRSDLFSLGMTLWWVALGGQLPFGNEKETVTERLSPDSYQKKLHETLSPDLAILLSGLVEKNAQNRHASAEDFLTLIDDSFPPLAIPALTKKAPAPAAEPVSPQVQDCALEQRYQLRRKISTNGPGAYFDAVRIHDGEKFWLWISEESSENTTALWREEFENRLALLLQNKPAGVSIPVSYEEFHGGTLAYTLQRHGGSFLGEGHQGRHQFSLSELMTPLENATRAADELVSLGFPLPEFTPDSIEWALGEFDFAPLLPTLIPPEITASASTTGTLSPDAIGHLAPGARFVMLIYPLIASRRFPLAALYTTSAYVTVPNICESSNRHLMDWACSEGQNLSLSSLLATLLASEGLKEHSMLSRGSRYQNTSAARTHFTPPPSRESNQTGQSHYSSRQPSASPTSIPLSASHGSFSSHAGFPSQNPSKGNASAPPPMPGRVVAPSLRPSVVIPPPPSEVSANPIDAYQPQKASFQNGPLPETVVHRSKKSRAGLVAILCFLVIFAATGGGAYWWFKVRPDSASSLAGDDKNGATKAANSPSELAATPASDSEKIARQNELKSYFFRKERAGELAAGLQNYTGRYGRDSFSEEAQSQLDRLQKQATQAIQVPGDVPTLTAAMKKVLAGQTIQLAPGTHRAQVICKPGVRIVGASDGSSVIEVPDAAASGFSIREGDPVYLENITLRALQKKDNSPALVTVLGGSLNAKNCRFQNNGSDAIHVLSGGKIDLQDCELSECEGNGILLVSKAQAQISDTRIHHNGKSGIRAAASEVSLSVRNCKITQNGESGVEADGGSICKITGGDFSENSKSGFIISGLGTRLEASGASFSNNGSRGLICLDGAFLTLEKCVIQDNKEYGLEYVKGKVGSTLNACQIIQNGVIGVMVEGSGQKEETPHVTLTQCLITKHSGAALAASAQAQVDIQEKSELINNSAGLISSSQSRIRITESLLRFRPGAGQIDFVEEDGGKISQIDMEIDEVK